MSTKNTPRAAVPAPFVWGEEQHPTRAEVEKAIESFCVEELCGADAGEVQHGGRSFNIAIRADLVDLNEPAPSAPGRPELSFDGFGINGPDEFRSRIATFTKREDGTTEGAKYGPLFAAAPELLATLEDFLKVLETHTVAGEMLRDVYPIRIQRARTLLAKAQP